MNRPITLSLLIILAVAGVQRPATALDDPWLAGTLTLANELSQELRHESAAIEYRRLALSVQDSGQQAACYWMAGWHYGKLAQFEQAETMLMRAETADWRLESPLNLLRGEQAFQRDRHAEALFFFNALMGDDNQDAPMRTYAARRLAVLRLREGRESAAVEQLSAGNWKEHPDEAREAIKKYAYGRDKNPRLGGWLGLVPGLGYAYAGEYANAFRSLLLNSLFIFGMVDSARQDNWGAFTAITFFELTWYTGSIYGGIDATHRYNRQRLESAEQAVMAGAWFEPGRARLPVLQLRFEF